MDQDETEQKSSDDLAHRDGKDELEEDGALDGRRHAHQEEQEDAYSADHGLARPRLALARGDLNEALEHSRRALRLNDSNAVQYAYDAAWRLYAGHGREAIQSADAGLRLVESGGARAGLVATKVTALHTLGQTAQANATLDDALASLEPETKPVLAIPLARLGRNEEARQLLALIEALERPPITILVQAYAALGDDRAFDWIHQGIEEHHENVTMMLRTNPVFADLRKDPRWNQVMSHLLAEEAKGRGSG